MVNVGKYTTHGSYGIYVYTLVFQSYLLRFGGFRYVVGSSHTYKNKVFGSLLKGYVQYNISNISNLSGHTSLDYLNTVFILALKKTSQGVF